MSATAPASAPRVRVGELISAVSAVALLVAMFAVRWFGVVGPAGHMRSGVNAAEDAWNGLTVTRWPMLASIAVALGSVVLHATQRRHGAKTNTSLLLTALGTGTAALLIYRVLIDMPAPDRIVDVKLGGFLGVLCAIGIALGGWESIREQRTRVAALAHRPRRKNRLTPGASPR